MIKKILILAIISTWALASLSFATTVPAGTILAVRTLDRVSSQDKRGKTFRAELDQDVAVKRNVLLKAGTKVSGRVESTSPFTLNLVNLSADGKTIKIQTTQGFQPQNNPRTAGGMRHGLSGGNFTVNAGAKMEFQLAQPINL
jgi:hypothetical protein